MILSCGGPPEWAWRSRNKNVLAPVAFCQRWNSRTHVSGSPRISRSGARFARLNSVPAGARFLPQNRDLTVTPTAANPGALPDNFLRPIVGYGDITITEPTGESDYHSLQMQLTRRFTGGIELAGSYTLARGNQNFFFQNIANNNNTVNGAQVYQSDITYMLFPGLSMVIFVIAFNLLGDSVRDALDPKSGR